MAADKISVMELCRAGFVPDCLTALKELGLKASANTDFDFTLNQAVSLGLVDETEEHILACLEQIKDMSVAE